VAARLEAEAVINAGPTPENVLGKVVERAPDVVLFVDAADFGGRPGELRVLSADDLAASDISTHSAPLSVSAEYLRQACGAESILLAAQPRDTRLGAVMSAEVIGAVETAAALIGRTINSTPRENN
jgi:hydrogenase 3 maturation protease